MITRRTFIEASLAGAASIGLAACGSSESMPAVATTEAAETAAADTSLAVSPTATGIVPVLVAYYSATGHTEAVANTIASALGAETFVIEPAEPYTSDDLNYNNDNSRVCQEHNNPNRNVVLVQAVHETFDDYNTVFVGYPIWWGDASWVVDNFVKSNNFQNKTVIPFCTSVSSDMGDSGQLLAQMAGTGDWQEGMRFSSSVDASEVESWLATLQLNQN